MALAISSGWPSRFQGRFLPTDLHLLVGEKLRSPGVSIHPGCTMLTRMRSPTSSMAAVRAMWSMAALAMS